ncbi:hypothetical protein [Cytobacillus oceanisediminis]|uniref:hypothetical protein n=1 Tax=Cytobacillus oceanisediminis TaxID=665099 RepID=UPI001FB4D924|nr:hypothetical protein [Cytobacillus oceanisediminis]UOE58027.1 hypothetical protein IRB79_27575 [Cytobacillus oceanisediminis]
MKKIISNLWNRFGVSILVLVYLGIGGHLELNLTPELWVELGKGVIFAVFCEVVKGCFSPPIDGAGS